MRRTLLGTLILRLRAEGLGESNKLTNVMRDVERTAREIGRTDVGSWGVAFQKQLAGLKLAANEVKAVRQSWIRLHKDMNQRDIGKAIRKAEISHWKNQTLAELAQQRAAIDRHFKALEARGTQHALRMGNVMKAGIAATGVGYTLPYAGGMAIRGGLTAASEQTRAKYRLQLANVSPDEIARMEAEAARLSTKYGAIDVQEVMELNRAAYVRLEHSEVEVFVMKDFRYVKNDNDFNCWEMCSRRMKRWLPEPVADAAVEAGFALRIDTPEGCDAYEADQSYRKSALTSWDGPKHFTDFADLGDPLGFFGGEKPPRPKTLHAVDHAA